jgi:hypothetical protein
MRAAASKLRGLVPESTPIAGTERVETEIYKLYYFWYLCFMKGFGAVHVQWVTC